MTYADETAFPMTSSITLPLSATAAMLSAFLLEMSPAHAALLFGTLALASASGRPDRRRMWPCLAALAIGMTAQFTTEGFVWQFLPAYALLMAVAVRTVRPRAGAAHPKAWRLTLAALSMFALLPWMTFLPVPHLPEPSGPYAVGTHTFRWVDASRQETAAADRGDRRHVAVQAWYPAAGGNSGTRRPYLDGIGRLPPSVSGLPRFVMARYGRTDVHAAEAEMDGSKDRWPVALFSPGYGATRSFYTAMLVDLASRGFVVLAVDHPYESAVTELADGRIATNVPPSPPAGSDLPKAMALLQDIRAADLRFVLDRISGTDAPEPLAGRLDLSRVAAIGHSFGGAAAMLAAADDARIAAAVNVDGTPYGSLPGRQLKRPLMLIESDRSVTRHSPEYLEGMERAFEGLEDDGWRFEIARSDHYGFTDAAFLLAPPSRWALERLLGGTRGAMDTQRVTAELLSAFMSGRDTDEIPATAARHVGVAGGQVKDRTAPQP